MVRQVTYGLTADDEDYFYPESDGQPMADNTLQFRWIVLIKENLEILFAAIKDVFVAGDLLWYPVRKAPGCAPDIMVVFGRPACDRGSYLQWEEGNIAPQVVFEILSPSNSKEEMNKKRDFYEKHGVEEYYLYDPETNNFQGWLRSKKTFKKITNINGWISPRLQTRFVLTTTLEIYRPDGRKFLTSVELEQRALDAEQRALGAEQRALGAEQQAEIERQRYQELLRQLQDRGIEL